jgi:hypothetical protein
MRDRSSVVSSALEQARIQRDTTSGVASNNHHPGPLFDLCSALIGFRVLNQLNRWRVLHHVRDVVPIAWPIRRIDALRLPSRRQHGQIPRVHRCPAVERRFAGGISGDRTV